MKRAIGVLALGLLPLSNAWAVEEAPELWKGEMGLAYAKSSGNSNSVATNFRSKAIRDGEQWKNVYKLEGANETSEDTRTSEKYFGSAKAEYKIGERSYLFGLVEYTDDRFSGYDYEMVTTFGYGQDIIRNDAHELSADAGIGYRRSELDDPQDDVQEEAVLRLGALYVWKISETATFDEDFSTEIGEDKTVTKSFTRLKLKINGSLDAVFAYEIKHTSEVPEGTKNSDRKTLVGLSYTF